MHNTEIKPTGATPADLECISSSECDVSTSMATSMKGLHVGESQSQEEPPNVMSTHVVVHEYLEKNSPDYTELHSLRRKGWARKEADLFFMVQRERADNADEDTRRAFYRIMIDIADEMDYQCGFLKDLLALDHNPQVLDLCMAPGGFTTAALNRHRCAQVCGISLPVQAGGHPMMLPGWENNKRLETLFLDITMLASEIGVANIPTAHPDFSKFSDLRPWFGNSFDLIYCDGAVLRTHFRAPYREKREGNRLLVSQLVLALQRIRTGGTLVCRLHKVEELENVNLLRSFDTFSVTQVIKPTRAHSSRSSFYMIAKNIQPQSLEALRAVNDWKEIWIETTISSWKAGDAPSIYDDELIQTNKAHEIVKHFGSRLIELATPMWKIQASALRKSRFISEDGYNATLQEPPYKNRYGSIKHDGYHRSYSRIWERKNWRTTNGSSKSGSPSTSATPLKHDRHHCTQYKQNPFLYGDPRLADHIEPKTFGRPSSSSHVWDRGWRNPVRSESVESQDTTPSQDITPSSASPLRTSIASDRFSTTVIGRPGGNLVEITNMKPSNALSDMDRHPNMSTKAPLAD